MRLIDADAITKKFGFTEDCLGCKHQRLRGCDEDVAFLCYVIYVAPTIDAVPVVRCRDCRFKADTIGKDEWCDLYEITVSGDHFCGDGRSDEAD